MFIHKKKKTSKENKNKKVWQRTKEQQSSLKSTHRSKISINSWSSLDHKSKKNTSEAIRKDFVQIMVLLPKQIKGIVGNRF